MSTKTKTKRVKQVFGNMSEIAHIFANEPGRDCRFGSGDVGQKMYLYTMLMMMKVEQSSGENIQG